MSLITEMVNKIHKRHFAIMHADKVLFEIRDEIKKGLSDKGLDYEVCAKINHEVYEIQIDYRKIEFTYNEIAKKLVDQIEISEDDVRCIMEKLIFDKLKL